MRSDKSIKVNLEAMSSKDLHRYPLHNIYIPNKYFCLLLQRAGIQESARNKCNQYSP